MAAEERSRCAEGGRAEASALQDSFDQGHQPWRGNPAAVARAGASCFFDAPPRSVEPAGPGRYVATDAAGRRATIRVTQPLGPGTVWIVTAITET
jgi:hypothetical protein